MGMARPRSGGESSSPLRPFELPLGSCADASTPFTRSRIAWNLPGYGIPISATRPKMPLSRVVSFVPQHPIATLLSPILALRDLSRRTKAPSSSAIMEGSVCRANRLAASSLRDRDGGEGEGKWKRGAKVPGREVLVSLGIRLRLTGFRQANNVVFRLGQSACVEVTTCLNQGLTTLH